MSVRSSAAYRANRIFPHRIRGPAHALSVSGSRITLPKQDAGSHAGIPGLFRRLRLEIGYGLGGPAGLGTLTPYAALGLAGDDARTWRAGARWSIAPDAALGLEGTLSESANDNAPEHGVMLRSAVRW